MEYQRENRASHRTAGEETYSSGDDAEDEEKGHARHPSDSSHCFKSLQLARLLLLCSMQKQLNDI